MRMDRGNKTFHCTCSSFKRPTSIASSKTAPKITKRCAHFYAVIWAILSIKELHDIFNYVQVNEERGNFQSIVMVFMVVTLSCIAESSDASMVIDTSHTAPGIIYKFVYRLYIYFSR